MPAVPPLLPEFRAKVAFRRCRGIRFGTESSVVPATRVGSVTSMPELALGRCLLETFCFDRENQNHYYARPMRDGVAVDSVAFARDARELRAALNLAGLPRLHDMLFDQSGEITYCLTGSVNEDGIALLRLDITGDLVLTCQRCLGPVNFGLSASRKFELVSGAESLGDPAQEPGDVERIHADPKLDVAALVEEETILSLPMVPGHPPGDCSPLQDANDGNEMKSPFSSLSALKGR
jgi:uncharacterized protein